MDITLVILSAGNSTRFNSVTKKQWLRIDTKPLWKFVADRLNSFYNFCDTIITANEDEVKLYELLSDYKITKPLSNISSVIFNYLNLSLSAGLFVCVKTRWTALTIAQIVFPLNISVLGLALLSLFCVQSSALGRKKWL